MEFQHAPTARSATGATRTLPESGEALLSTKDVAAAFGVTRQTVWAWSKQDPHFPAPVRRGTRCTRFKLSEVRQYIARMSRSEVTQ